MDRFGVQSSPRFPSCEFTVFVEQSPHTSRKINYNIPLHGVEPKDMKICLFCSLSSTGMYVYCLIIWILIQFVFSSGLISCNQNKHIIHYLINQLKTFVSLLIVGSNVAMSFNCNNMENKTRGIMY